MSPTERDSTPGEARIRDLAIRILSCGDLDSKLAPPTRPVQGLADDDAGPAWCWSAPAREPGLEMAEGVPGLPRPGALRDARARALCLARFAHHELMAVELFAFALLCWPTAPSALRRDWLRVLCDEQRHCRLYLGRLRALGHELTRHAPHSGYFWKQAASFPMAPDGVSAFLAAMGLTLEQANLDFTLLYRDAFREAGDEASARVCQQVHDDEVRHVAVAARWLEQLAGLPLRDAYAAHVPFPLSAARAKGRRFEAAPRLRAGLGEEFVTYVRDARSRQERPPESAAEE